MIRNVYFILFFTYIYSQTTFNILDVASNAKDLSLTQGGLAQSSQYLTLNPASLYIEKYGVQFSKHVFPNDIYLAEISTTFNYNEQIIMSRIKTANYGQLEDAVTHNIFNAKDIIIELGSKFNFKNILSVGYSGGYIKSKIEQYQSEGMFFSTGIKAEVLDKRLGLAAALTHLGMQLSTFNKTPENMPSAKRFGLFYKPQHLSAKIYIDYINYSNESNNQFLYGVEFNKKNYFLLRFSTGNYKNQLKSNNALFNIISGISTGIGIKIKKINIDFSIQNLGAGGLVIGTSVAYNN